MTSAQNWIGRTGYYAIVDPDHCSGRSAVDVAATVLTGGCAVLQLRTKRADGVEFLELARAIKTLCTTANVPFVVNDRADIAAVVDADGLHLGQNDLPIADARRMVGDLPIGVSTHSLEQARTAQAQGANLIGFGPVFATTTKRNPDPVVGIDGLAKVCAEAQVPVVAIGGITIDNAASARTAGANFVASISAVIGQPNVAAAAKAMHEAAR